MLTALRAYLQETTHDDRRKQEIAAAYYDIAITDEQLTSLVGADEAADFRVLKRQLSDDYIEGISNS